MDVYIYTQVDKAYRHFIGHYKAVAYCALPEGCSSGFVYRFTVWYFLQQRIFTGYQTKVEIQLTTTALWEVILVNLDT